MDVATRLISLEDDPALPVFTLRMWFLGLGLSCFGAVLGQIFVCIIPCSSLFRSVLTTNTLSVLQATDRLC